MPPVRVITTLSTMTKNKSGTYVDAYNVKDFDSAEVEDNYKTLLKKNTTKYYKSD